MASFLQKRLINPIRRWLVRSLYEMYPDLLNREHVSDLLSGSSDTGMHGFRGFAQDYRDTAWVHTAVSKWGDAFFGLPLRVVDLDDKPVNNHPLNSLLEFINPQSSTGEIWRQWAIDMALGGESGFEFERSGKVIVAAWPRQPHTYEPVLIRSAFSSVLAYKIDLPDVGFPRRVSPLDFCHWRFYNPLKPHRGLSRMAAIRMSVGVEQNASAWSKSFFDNGARPDAVLIVPEGVSKTERDAIEEKFHERTGKTSKGLNWHKVIVLENGVMDFKPINFTSRDMQFAETRRLTQNEIGAIFGIPDEILGIGKNTYENFQHALLTFYSETVVPLATFRDSALSRFFRVNGMLTPLQRVATDFSKVPVLQRLREPLLKAMISYSQVGVPFKIVNEVLRLGVPDYPAASFSFPFGTRTSFDDKGKSVDTPPEELNKPSGETSAEKEGEQ